MLKHAILVTASFLAQEVYADLNIPGLDIQPLNILATQDQTLARTGLTNNEDDITPEQELKKIELNPLQLHQAKIWNLSEDEEKRYIFLMQNRSKIYYEGLNLTPLDILGINARNDSERTHFATLASLQEAQKVAKNIAWNNAFYKAYNKLFAHIPVVGDFDPSPYSPYAHRPIRLNPNDTLFIFLKPDDPIKTILMVLTEAINNTPDARLNFLFLECDDLAIQLWANKFQINPNLVNSGRITLNHGDLNYQALKIDTKKTPLLLLSKNGSSAVVDLGGF